MEEAALTGIGAGEKEAGSQLVLTHRWLNKQYGLHGYNGSLWTGTRNRCGYRMETEMGRIAGLLTTALEGPHRCKNANFSLGKFSAYTLVISVLVCQWSCARRLRC